MIPTTQSVYENRNPKDPHPNWLSFKLVLKLKDQFENQVTQQAVELLKN